MSKTFEVGLYQSRYSWEDDEDGGKKKKAPPLLTVKADSFNVQDGNAMFYRDGEPIAYFTGVQFVREVSEAA